MSVSSQVGWRGALSGLWAQESPGSGKV